MKTKTKITFFLLIVAAALIGANAYILFFMEDRHAPVISFPAETGTYSDGMDDATLLSGVTASDDEDGDVTDSLRVGEILRSADGTEVTVVYVARDGSNNIAQSSRIMRYSGAAVQAETEEDSETDGTSGTEGEDKESTESAEAESAAEEQATPQPTQEPQEEEADPNELGKQENEAAIAALSAGAPRMYLTDYAVTVSVGSEFNALGYVEDIQDDVTSRNELYLGIQIRGSVDTSTRGTYELYYYVFDDDGNSSNEAKLVVTVA